MSRIFAVLTLLAVLPACEPQPPKSDEVAAQVVGAIILQCARTPNNPPPGVSHC